MAWTQDDLDTIEAAIIKLADGKRVTRHDIGMKDRGYQEVTLRQLLELRSLMTAELTAADEPVGFRRVQTTVKSDTW